MICLNQRGLRSLSASSFFFLPWFQFLSLPNYPQYIHIYVHTLATRPKAALWIKVHSETLPCKLAQMASLWHKSWQQKIYTQCWYYVWFKCNLNRSTMHPKFDLTRVWTYDLQVMALVHNQRKEREIKCTINKKTHQMPQCLKTFHCIFLAVYFAK